ncbi:MAG: DUF2344 domain-containing protein [Anaerolineae bacterium]|nr:DUF2344 domain-containing protein [Anaerolineae bacterium]
MAQSAQRLRITFVKGEQIRWVSHMDLVRLWERALRRAGIPMAYTQGFNPQMRIQFASALPTGCSGRAELADVWLAQGVPPETFVERLREQLPTGVKLLDAWEVDRRAPSLQSLVRSAEWQVVVDAPEVADETIERRVAEILEASEWMRERRRRPNEPPRRYDLRSLIYSLRFDGRDEDGRLVLTMHLKAEPGATGRPDEVLDALGLGGLPSQMERTVLHLATPEREGAG